MNLSLKMAEYRREPVKFVREMLKAEPQKWQARAMELFMSNKRLAIRAGRGVGKTALAAWLILNFLFTRRGGKVICTAPTARQLYSVLWSELSRWLKSSAVMSELFEYQKTSIRMRSEADVWFAIARTAAKPEAIQGFHGEHMLFLFDEASGITDEIFDACIGSLTGTDNKLILLGNPTRRGGFFFRAFHEERERYAVMKVACADSEQVSAEFITHLKAVYGEGSDVYRVHVLGEFPAAEADGLIALEMVEAAQNREGSGGDLVIGVDVARFGDDETVLAARLGQTLIQITGWRHTDLMTTVGKVKLIVEGLLSEHKKNSAQIYIDETGLGGGVVDRLREVLKVQIMGVNNGSRAHDAEHYVNRGTEIYFSLRQRFTDGDIALSVRSDKLVAELTARRYGVNSRGQLVIEPKADFKRRLNRSPDTADAVALCFITSPKFSAPQMIMQKSYWLR